MMLQGDADPVSALSAPHFLDAGEAAFVVEFGDTVDPAINEVFRGRRDLCLAAFNRS
jgi:inhibitor of KinA